MKLFQALVVVLLLTSMVSATSWWSSSWSYRKGITINNTQNANNLTDYQVKVITNFSKEYSDNKVQQYCGDVRFTYYNLASETETEIPYWIETCDLLASDNATFWVKVPFIQNNSNAKVYMYYGNPSASSKSNGTATFDFFDDFKGTSLDTSKWTVEKEGSENAIVELDGNGNLHLAGEPNVISSGNVLSNATFTNGFDIRVRRKYSEEQYPDISIGNGVLQDEDNGGQSSWWHTSQGDAYVWKQQSLSERYINKDPSGGSKVELSGSSSSFGALNTYEVDDFTYGINGNLEWVYNGVKRLSAKNTDYLTTAKHLLLSQGEYSNGAGGDSYYDWVLVCKYASPEPTTSVGAEGTFTPDFMITSTSDFNLGAVFSNTSTNTQEYIPSDQLQLSFPYASKDNNLVSYWRFENNINDEAGVNNEGYGDVPYSKGKYGKALDFTGTSNWVTIPDSNSLDTPTEYTQSFWFKTTTTSNLVIIEKGNGRYFVFSDDPACGGKFMAGAINAEGDRVSAPMELNDNAWHMMTITYKELTNLSMYVDGSLVNSTIPNEKALSNNYNYTIGARYTGVAPFDGLVDGLKIYNRALTPEEITNLYNEGKQYKEKGTWESASQTIPDWKKMSSTTIKGVGLNISKVQWLRGNDSVVLAEYNKPITSNITITNPMLTSGNFSNVINNYKIKIFLQDNSSITPEIQQVYGYYEKTGYPVVNSPSSGATGVSTSPVLNFTVYDNTGSMNVTLYSVTTGKVLKTWTNVSNGTTLTYTWWTRRKNTTYEWYVNATNDGDSITSGVLNFTTDDTFNVNACAELWASGNYNMINNITNSAASTCMKITGDNIAFDGQGHLINGSGSGNGFYAKGRTNITVKNCSVSNYYYDFYIKGSNDTKVSDSTLSSSNYGFYFPEVVKNIVISGNKVESSEYGLYSPKGVNNTLVLQNSTIENNFFDSTDYYHGILVHASFENSTIKGNEFTNAFTGIFLVGKNVAIKSNNIHKIYKRGVLISYLGMTSGARIGGNVIIENNEIHNDNKGSNSYCIYLSYASNNIIQNNSLHYCHSGVFYDASYYNLIYDNDIFDNINGLEMSGSDPSIGGNNFSSNRIYGNTNGIFDGGDIIGNNTYEYNNITNNDYGYEAAFPINDTYKYNLIANNNYYGIYIISSGGSGGGGSSSVGSGNILRSSNNKVIESNEGFNNVWEENNITSNLVGIVINDDYTYSFINNSIYSNTYGIGIANNGSNFINNTLTSNDYGVYVTGAIGVTLNNNTILNSSTWDFYAESGSEATVTNMTFNKTLASFVATDVAMKYEPNPPANPPNQYNGQSFINITNNDASAWVDLNLSYNETPLVNENNVWMWRYDSSWQRLPGTINTISNYVNYNITSFSTFGLFEDQSPQNMTLVSPINRTINGTVYYVTDQNVTFVFNVTGINNITNCTLWNDFTGAWQAWKTNNNITLNSSNNISFDFQENVNYLKWNVQCTDTAGNSVFASENRTVKILETVSEGNTTTGGGSGYSGSGGSSPSPSNEIKVRPLNMTFNLEPNQKTSGILNVTNLGRGKVTIELKTNQTGVQISSPLRVLDPNESVGFLITISVPSKGYEGFINVYADGVKKLSVPIEVHVSKEPFSTMLLKKVLGDDKGEAVQFFMSKALLIVGGRIIYVAAIFLIISLVFAYFLLKDNFIAEAGIILLLVILLFALFKNFII